MESTFNKVANLRQKPSDDCFRFTYTKSMLNNFFMDRIIHSSYVRFFLSNTFLSNARLKFSNNQANPKQQREAELIIFGNYSHL